MDKKRLSCRLCDFKSDDLVSHIETKHADHAEGKDFADGILAWYLSKFNLDENGIVFPEGELMADTIEISGVHMTKGSGGVLVPKINPAYYFSAFVPDVLHDIKENNRIMLTGHTGCGKTSLIEQLAARTDNGFLRVNLNGQTTISDFVGMWTVRGGEMVWVDGILPKAMREGHWLILDEIDFGESAILSVLNSVLERNGKLMLKEKNHEVVEPHANFRVFATANTVGCMSAFRGLYQGTNLMNEAFLDRWRVYLVEYLPAEQEAKVLTSTITPMTDKVAGVVVRVANMVREAFKKEEIQCTFSLRRLLDWSSLMIRYRDPMRAAEASIFNKISPQDKEVIEGIIKRIMIGNK